MKIQNERDDVASAIYAGSFDPPTWGHLDIISQAVDVFDKVCILIAEDSRKEYMFSSLERKKIWEDIVENRDLGDKVIVEMLPPATYAIHWAQDHDYTHMIRGLRNARDFEEEIVIQDTNRRLEPIMKTAYFISKPEYRTLSSSLVKSLIGYRWWTSILAYDCAEAIIEKLGIEREE